MEDTTVMELDEVEMIVVKNSLIASLKGIERELKKRGLGRRERRMLESAKQRREDLLSNIEGEE